MIQSAWQSERQQSPQVSSGPACLPLQQEERQILSSTLGCSSTGTAKAPFATWNYKTISVFCLLPGGKLANPKPSTLTMGREVATASELSSWQLCSKRLSFHFQMLTNLAVRGEICNFPCPSFPVSMGRAQTDLEPTPRHSCHGKQEQTQPPARDTCPVLVTQGNVCLTRP